MRHSGRCAVLAGGNRPERLKSRTVKKIAPQPGECSEKCAECNGRGARGVPDFEKYCRGSTRPAVAKHADAALRRTCERACSSFVRPKRTERRSAVDRAFGRAKQARSTWPWSERWPVGASAAQKGASGARVCRTRAGQHRIPLSRPKGGIAVISMFEPALASLSLKSLHWLALALRSQTPFSLMQVGGGNS